MKKRLPILLIAAMILTAVLTACLPSGLTEGYNDDPRGFSDYDEFSASIYVKNGLALPYRLYSPQNTEDGKRYPLLIFLHGSGENGVDNKKQVYGNFVKNVLPLKDTLGEFYVMIPQAKDKVTWDYYLKEDAGNVLSSAIDDLIARKETIDEDRLYLAGLSLGGFGTISELRLESERFAAAFSICGGISDYWYEGENYRPTEAVFQEIAKTPLLLAHGGKDTNVPPEYSAEIYDGVKNAGGEVRLEWFDQMEHNIWDRCFETKEYWEWLFSHQKNAA